MAMPDVYDQIFQYGKKYIKENSKYSPKILKSTQQDKIFPFISIKEIRDDLYDENLDKTDQRFNIGYEIEIYTMTRGSIAKEEVAEELKGLVNDVFDTHYGLRRTLNKEIPNVDLNVFRWGMRFEGKIDEKTQNHWRTKICRNKNRTAVRKSAFGSRDPAR